MQNASRDASSRIARLFTMLVLVSAAAAVIYNVVTPDVVCSAWCDNPFEEVPSAAAYNHCMAQCVAQWEME